MIKLAVTLAALYLRGGPRSVELRRSAWPEVLRILRRANCEPGHAPEALREAGRWAEALVLESPGLLDWASSIVEGGRVLSVVDGGYPCRWARVLGCSAPPILWKTGELAPLPSVSVVGSRIVPSVVSRFCHRAAREAARLGFAVFSGRAEGCDRAAAAGALSIGGAVVEVLPNGIGLVRSPAHSCMLSVCAPDEPFSSAAAMERNVLIYAASSHTIIGQARFKEGGTWHGAVHAARSRLSSLIVRRSDDIAMRSLAALGGLWLDSPSDLALALKSPAPQRELFESAG
ncbi:MAG: DNA-processing protein DprA [Fimbriimonadales bacterium]